MVRFVTAMAFAGGLLAFAAGAHAQTPAPDKGLDPALVAQGRGVYAKQKCAECHSIGGAGDTDGPIDDAGLRYSREELRLWIVQPRQMEQKVGATRKPRMPAYRRLSARDVDAIVEFMASLRKP
jgi:mono/diheme cytochrome c family protein